jgi:hypothetical protein
LKIIKLFFFLLKTAIEKINFESIDQPHLREYMKAVVEEIRECQWLSNEEQLAIVSFFLLFFNFFLKNTLR